MKNQNQPIQLPEQIAEFFDEVIGKENVGVGMTFTIMLEELAAKDKFMKWFKRRFGDNYLFAISDCARYGWDAVEPLFYVVLPGVAGELSQGYTLNGQPIGHGRTPFRESEITDYYPQYRQFLVPVDPELYTTGELDNGPR